VTIHNQMSFNNLLPFSLALLELFLVMPYDDSESISNQLSSFLKGLAINLSNSILVFKKTDLKDVILFLIRIIFYVQDVNDMHISFFFYFSSLITEVYK